MLIKKSVTELSKAVQDFTYINSIERGVQETRYPKNAIVNPNKAVFLKVVFSGKKGSILRGTSNFKKT